MPRRARPGNRERIEAALTPSLRRALTEQCELLGIRRAGWQATPLEPGFTTCAVIREADRIRELRGGSLRHALEAAAVRLGVSALTARNRAERMSTASITLNGGRMNAADPRRSARNNDQEAA